MTKICPKCGKEIDDDILKCPLCNTDIINEEQGESSKTQNQLPEINPNISEQISISKKNEIEEVGVEVDNLDGVIVNDELETISVEASSDNLLEEEEKIEEFILPVPTIEEINPNVLGNVYDEAERLNNEKREAKRLAEEAELERKRQEEEARKQIPIEKPDLLGSAYNDDINIDFNKKKEKKPMRKVMNIIIIILGLAVVVALVYYFFFKEKEDKNAYLNPINVYFEGYKNGDSEKMLTSYIPCLSKSEEIITLINNTIATRNQYENIYLEFNESSTEVVNNDDRDSLNTYLKEQCGTDIPEIKEYKHVFIEQKVKTAKEDDYAINKPEFWTVKIDSNWYILLIQ